MSEHFNTEPGWPQTEVETIALDVEHLQAFAEQCDAEPAEPNVCLACLAYVELGRRDDDVGRSPLRFEMDGNGNHRIVNTEVVESSDWTPYASLSRLEVDGVVYIGATAYWEGTLPIECVIRIEPLPQVLGVAT